MDADAFFAAVEQAADARLRGRPMAVGGEKRGIIASASYEARKFGVYTPMPTARARKLCPKLIIVPGDYQKYEQFSNWMFSYLYDFTPNVERCSIDEGYCDWRGVRGRPEELVPRISQIIWQSLKISVSQGLASNKVVSHIASKLKKPAGFIHVPNGQEKAFLFPLANSKLPGIGPKTATRLNAAGLTHIGQIAQTPIDCLSLLLGAYAPRIKQFANGEDDRPVVVDRSEPAKSYSHQRTFGEDITDEQFAEASLRAMADSLMQKVRGDGKMIRTVTVKVRYNDFAEDQCSESLDEPTDLETDIYGNIHKLLRRAWRRRVSLRLVSLKLSKVYNSMVRAELLLDQAAHQREDQRKLASALDQLREKRGKYVVMRGHDLWLKKYKVRKKPEPENLKPERFLNENKSKPSSRFPHPVPHAIPLHVHSYYSFLDSTLSVEALVDEAVRYDMPSLALTDTNGLYGAVPFYETAKKAGIKPIIGAEIQWQGRTILLVAQDKRGYQNLCHILNDTDSLFGSVRASPSIFSINLEGDALTEPQKKIQLSDTTGLLAIGSDPKLAEYFPDRFYLGASCTKSIERYGKTSLPIVAVPGIHYREPSDRKRFNIVQSIRTLTLLDQRHTEKKHGGAYHFFSPAEMALRFEGCWDALEMTQEIADRCAFEFSLGQLQFPAYLPEDGSTAHDFLRHLVLRGMGERYSGKIGEVQPQIEEELSIIAAVGYEEYFLMVWDILQLCKAAGIEWITRGSAADSLVCYCLGISDVCPIRFGLYFRRFLNRERMHMNKLPDIDVDFPHDRKEGVLKLIFDKYGEEHAAIVGGFSTFKARSAMAEVAKVLGVSDYQIRRITERLPHGRARDIEEKVRARPECGDLDLSEEPYATAVRTACFLDGFPRHPKMHPCGVVLSREPMKNLTPCFMSASGYQTTHFDMDAVEAVGLVKIDVLSQAGLSVMRDVKAMLRQRNMDVDLKALKPWKDTEIWAQIASGQSRAVHHIESPAMIGLSRMCNVRDIDTLIAVVSVIRPGAANEHKKLKFTRRYQKKEPTPCIHPSLDACLNPTYGLIVYEEQVLQVCEAFAGWSPEYADRLRRALSRENEEKLQELAKIFADHAQRRGRSQSSIVDVWKLLRGFSGYAFCKAHSTVYGIEAYESAWLKKHYPAEFMAAVLTQGKGFYSRLVYVLESRRLGIEFMPMSVNVPGPGFIVHDGRIEVPVIHTRGLTEMMCRRLVLACYDRPFTSLRDFYIRVRPKDEEMELLLRVGAFDEFSDTRTALFWESKWLREVFARDDNPNEPPLLPPPPTDRVPEVALTESAQLNRLKDEMELLGFTVSAHPLALYDDIAWDTYCPIAELGNHVGQRVVCCGLIVQSRIAEQVDGRPMKFISIADWTGMVETEFFARTYQKYGLATVRYAVLELTATVEPYENHTGFTLRVHRAGEPRKSEGKHAIFNTQ